MMSSADVSPRAPIRVAVAGLGGIGQAVAEALNAGIEGCELTAVSAKDKSKAAQRLKGLKRQIPIVDIAALETLADIVVECVPANLFSDVAGPFLSAGKKVIALSSGALLSNWDLVDLARENGGQIIVPSGALLGLDAVAAAAQGQIHSVRMVTRKPVRGLVGAPYLVQNNIDIAEIKEPLRVFNGTAREAATGFPANLNVAVSLSLAGAGPDRTKLEIWADPSLQRNCHSIVVESDSASFSMSISNVPSENPKTGRITARSVIACLRNMRAPLRVGA